MHETLARLRRRRGGLSTGLVLVGVTALAPWLFRRLEVTGSSMEPTFQPGDRLVLRRRLLLPVRSGHIVAFKDPRGGQVLLLKRVRTIGRDGVEVVGDNAAASTDSRTFGPVPLRSIRWVVLRRYSSMPQRHR